MTAPAFRRPPDGRLIPTPTPRPAARPRFYTANEVAAMARVSKMTVYRLGPELGAVRVGRLLRYPADVVDAYLGRAEA